MAVEKQQLPWWKKYTLTLNEALEYFGIGYKELSQFIQDHQDESFVLWKCPQHVQWLKKRGGYVIVVAEGV